MSNFCLTTAVVCWSVGCSILFGVLPSYGQGVVHAPALVTRWSKDVSATNCHREYPRPTLVRNDWLNLNGLWDCCITHRDQTNAGKFESTILVPFPIEANLSGVRRLFTEQQ